MKPLLHSTAYKGCIFISIMSVSSPNRMFDHLLESSHRDDSNKQSNIGFGEGMTQVGSIDPSSGALIVATKWEPIANQYN